MKTLAFFLILSCAACTEMKPMSDFGMAVYNSKPETLKIIAAGSRSAQLLPRRNRKHFAAP
jgi:hypothetical protein